MLYAIFDLKCNYKYYNKYTIIEFAKVFSNVNIETSTCNSTTCVHGTCNDQCMCENSWTGPFCNTTTQTIQPVFVTSNSTTSVVTVTTNTSSSPFQFKYNLNVVSIAKQGANIQDCTVFLDSVTFNISQQTTEDAVVTNYTASLGNEATFQALVYLFTVPTNITFANATTTYYPNTVKLTFKVENWLFTSLTNTFLIAIRISQSNTTSTDTCRDGNHNRVRIFNCLYIKHFN
jgi:hypothetical protein